MIETIAYTFEVASGEKSSVAISLLSLVMREFQNGTGTSQEQRQSVVDWFVKRYGNARQEGNEETLESLMIAQKKEQLKKIRLQNRLREKSLND